MSQVKTVNVSNDYLRPEDVNNYSATDLPTIDIRNGSQWGALPVVGNVENGASINDWMHEQQYLRNDLIPVVLSVPKGFELLPNADQWKQAVKAMLEVHAKTIDGLDSSLTVDKVDKDLGLSGAKFSEVANVTRASSTVSITVEERYGTPFEILLDVWIRVLLRDPDLKAPLITRIADASALPKVWSPEWTTMSAIFIEPDILLRKPIRAFLVSNMFPSANADIVGKKDKSAGREGKVMTIELGGWSIPSTNNRVMKLANDILTKLKLYELDPDQILLPITEIDTSLAEVPEQDIYYEGVNHGVDTDNMGDTGADRNYNTDNQANV